ncbi:hypothetical protein J6590_010851 [Homalodisca vitripennis]|nr:hypothetical protein J6590_010851 [Homalodisca vitripennis]
MCSCVSSANRFKCSEPFTASEHVPCVSVSVWVVSSSMTTGLAETLHSWPLRSLRLRPPAPAPGSRASQRRSRASQRFHKSTHTDIIGSRASQRCQKSTRTDIIGSRAS